MKNYKLYNSSHNHVCYFSNVESLKLGNFFFFFTHRPKTNISVLLPNQFEKQNSFKWCCIKQAPDIQISIPRNPGSRWFHMQNFFCVKPSKSMIITHC